MPRLRPRAVLSASDLPTTKAVVPAQGGGVTMATTADTAAAATATDPGANNFIGRLVTYIPAEVIATYQTILGFVSDPGYQKWIGIAMLVATPFWIYFSTKNSGEPPAWHQIINATIAFAAWLLLTGSPIIAFLPFPWQSEYGSLLMAALVVIFPGIEKLTTPAPATT